MQSTFSFNLQSEIDATCADAARKIAKYRPRKWVLHTLREEPSIERPLFDNPDSSASYWSAEVASDPHLSLETETMVVVMLDTRRRVKGHVIAATGTLDTLLVHPREIFRPAIVASAAAIVLMHNHPSGDPYPSEADIRVTRDLIRAGQLLKIEVLDHVIIGLPSPQRPRPYVSLREIGFMSL